MTSIDKYKRPRKGVPKAEVVDDGHTMQPQKDNTWQQDVAEWLTPSDAGALQHVVSLVNTFGKEGGEVDQLQDVLAARAGQGHVVEQVAGDIIGAGGVAGAAKKSLDKLTPDLSDIKKWLLGTGTTSFAKEPLEATDTIPDELIERAKTAGIDLAGISAGFGVGKGAELLGNFVGGVKKGRMGEMPASTQKNIDDGLPMSENTLTLKTPVSDFGVQDVGRAGAQTAQQTQGAGLARAALEGAGKILNMKPDAKLTAAAEGAMDTKALKGMNDALVAAATPKLVGRVPTDGTSPEIAERLGKAYKQQYAEVFDNTPIPRSIEKSAAADAKDLRHLAKELTGDAKLSGALTKAADIIEAAASGNAESFNTFYKLINKSRRAMPPEFSDGRKWLDEYRNRIVKAMPEDKRKILQDADASYPEYLAFKDASDKAAAKGTGVFTFNDISGSAKRYTNGGRQVYGDALEAYANYSGAQAGMTLKDLNTLVDEGSAFNSPLLKKAFKDQEDKFKKELLGHRKGLGKVTEQSTPIGVGIGLGAPTTIDDFEERKKRRGEISSVR